MRVRIDGEDLAGAIREFANGLGERLREHAFAVILDDDRIDLRQQRLELRERRGGVLRLHLQLFLPVDPHDVLLPRDDARLDDGLVAGVRLDGVDVDAFAGQQSLEMLRRARTGRSRP